MNLHIGKPSGEVREPHLVQLLSGKPRLVPHSVGDVGEVVPVVIDVEHGGFMAKEPDWNRVGVPRCQR